MHVWVDSKMAKWIRPGKKNPWIDFAIPTANRNYQLQAVLQAGWLFQQSHHIYKYLTKNV